jgi:hypothetical protein
MAASRAARVRFSAIVAMSLAMEVTLSRSSARVASALLPAAARRDEALAFGATSFTGLTISLISSEFRVAAALWGAQNACALSTFQHHETMIGSRCLAIRSTPRKLRELGHQPPHYALVVNFFKRTLGGPV